MRFAKIFRFGKRRADVGVDLGNLLNTNYTTTYENTYQYSVGNTAHGRHVEQPDGDLHAAVRPLESDGRLLTVPGISPNPLRRARPDGRACRLGTMVVGQNVKPETSKSCSAPWYASKSMELPAERTRFSHAMHSFGETSASAVPTNI